MIRTRKEWYLFALSVFIVIGAILLPKTEVKVIELEASLKKKITQALQEKEFRYPDQIYIEGSSVEARYYLTDKDIAYIYFTGHSLETFGKTIVLTIRNNLYDELDSDYYRVRMLKYPPPGPGLDADFLGSARVFGGKVHWTGGN